MSSDRSKFRQSAPAIFACWACLSLCAAGCAAGPLENYIRENPDLPAQKILAMREGWLVNGMTEHEVRLTLGEPKHFDKSKQGNERWIYRDYSGMEKEDAYTSGTSFPSGIGFVIPLHYLCREIQVDFHGGKVCQIQEILSF